MNPKIKNQLTIAYLETLFSVEAPGNTIWVSPLSDNPEFSAYLKENKIKNWAIITPCNPKSKELSDTENNNRIELFIKEGLHDQKTGKKKWDYLKSFSKPADGSLNNGAQAKSEDGFFILNIFPWEAVKLGYEYEQNAILISKDDGFAELQWTDHESKVYFSADHTR